MSLSMIGIEDSVTGTSGVVEREDELHQTLTGSAEWIRSVSAEGEQSQLPRPVLDTYVEYLTALGMAPQTCYMYTRALTRFWAHAANDRFDATEATALELGSFTETLPNSAKRQHRAALRHWYESMGRMDAALKAMRVPPKKRGVSRALEPDEASRLARVAIEIGHPGGMAVLLGLYLGLRRAEISRVRWDCFDDDFEWYTFMGKLDIVATLPVHPVLKEVMQPIMTAFPSVFPGRSTMHTSKGTIGYWVRQVGDVAQINRLSPHQLRHTAIATINDSTGDLRMAQEFARHADVETTQIYTRVNRDRLLRAIDTLNYLDDEPTHRATHHTDDERT